MKSLAVDKKTLETLPQPHLKDAGLLIEKKKLLKKLPRLKDGDVGFPSDGRSAGSIAFSL